MPTSIDHIIEKLRHDQRKVVERRTVQLIAGETALRELWHTRRLSRALMARKPGKTSVSREG